MSKLPLGQFLAMCWWEGQGFASISEYKEVYGTRTHAIKLVQAGYLEETGRDVQTTGEPEPEYRISKNGMAILRKYEIDVK